MSEPPSHFLGVPRCSERPKMDIGEYGFIGHFIDTEGNRLGLHSMK